MASELTEGFKKSRNRLMYFCGIGILLCFFPIDEGSSLFGIKFKNLDSDSVNTIFTIITTAFFFECLIRMIEERVALFGEHANVFKRLEHHRLYTKQISCELQKLSQFLDEHQKIHRKTDKEVADQIINVKERIEKWSNSAKSEYMPGNINTLFGQLRVYVEYFSGSLIFFLYLFFQFRECCNA